MYCPCCGQRNDDHGLFCSKCGVQLDKQREHRKSKKPLFIALAAVALVALLVVIVVVSQGSQSNPKKVAEDFLEALSRGDYRKTISLLDPVSMEGMAADFDTSIDGFKDSLSNLIKDLDDKNNLISIQVNNNRADVYAEIVFYDRSKDDFEFQLIQRRDKWYVDPNIFYEEFVSNDRAIAKIVNNAWLNWQFELELSERDDATFTWEELKKYLSEDVILYFENIKSENLSGSSLSASLCDGGWIRVYTGRIIIQESEGELWFIYREEKPN